MKPEPKLIAAVPVPPPELMVMTDCAIALLLKPVSVAMARTVVVALTTKAAVYFVEFGVGAEPSPAIVSSASTGQEPNRLSPEGVMDNLQIRPHERNPNLWWISSQGDDVAYITRPGNGYLAWATDKWKPNHADFVGKRFDSVDEALQAVAGSFS